jgi:Leucine-rich repeat (LRR) protein
VSLDIHKTQIRDASWLKVMKNLKYVEITKTPICDLSVLKDHKHILFLNVSDTLITDISFIENYEHLGKLDVTGCPIEDYTLLLKIRPLDMLIIDEKAVTSIGMDNLVKHHPDAVIEIQQKINNRKV